ncbi:unnamed protein product [Strongylus vulgaris]|uniref:Uncharacterized protein n=1 Tax=Strongylus vulgaris TaxID=40348 RepID=A0A3P7JCL6_STRVU|nr:unnamed protein product [Strongylus vulgaris]
MRGRHAVRRSIARTSSGSSSNLSRLASSSENLNISANSSASTENHTATVTSTITSSETVVRNGSTTETTSRLSSSVEIKVEEKKELTEAPITPVFCVGGEGIKLETDQHLTPMTRKRSSDADLGHDIPSKKLLHVKSDNGLPVIAGDTDYLLCFLFILW